MSSQIIPCIYCHDISCTGPFSVSQLTAPTTGVVGARLHATGNVGDSVPSGCTTKHKVHHAMRIPICKGALYNRMFFHQLLSKRLQGHPTPSLFLLHPFFCQLIIYVSLYVFFLCLYFLRLRLFSKCHTLLKILCLRFIFCSERIMCAHVCKLIQVELKCSIYFLFFSY